VAERSRRPHTGATLKVRLSLIITSLMALLTAVGGWYVITRARDDVREEVRSTLSLTGHFLDAQLDVLRDHWMHQGYAMPLFQLRELRDVRHVNIRFVDPLGRILDSNEDDEGRQPQAPRWFTALVRMTSPPVSPQIRTVSFDGAPVGTLVMAADPTYEIDEMWNTSSGLLELLLAFFLLVNLLIWWAVSRALRPIERILVAFDDLRAGRLTTRLPEFNVPEMSRLSVGFNHMTETLEGSLDENQRLTRELLNAQETERRNIAHDLHDEIGQCVSAIHADAVAIRNRGGESVRESAEAIVQVTSQIKENVRSMLRRIKPAYLEGLGLEAAVREQVANFAHRHPEVTCALKVDGDLACVDGEVGVAVYRVVQESLTNIAMHAKARNALIEIRVLDEGNSAGPEAKMRVHLAARDDGTGFFQILANRGLGLTGIRERVRALGGWCEIESELGRGTQITVSLPVCARSEADERYEWNCRDE
jgi:two-component system, NarL family, sensor histidine kinase UhpB